MSEHDPLARRSHELEDLALQLATEGVDMRLIAHELESGDGASPEVAAMALSYLLRRRALASGETGIPAPLPDPHDPDVIEIAIDAMVTVLRRATRTR